MEMNDLTNDDNKSRLDLVLEKNINSERVISPNKLIEKPNLKYSI